MTNTQIKILSKCYKKPLPMKELVESLGHVSVSGNIRKALKTLISYEFMGFTIPEKPNSKLQKYRLTNKGKAWLDK